MSGDVQVRFCESVGVRCPGATHRNIYVRSRRAGERVMKSLTRFISAKLKLQVNQSKSAVAEPWEEVQDEGILRVGSTSLFQLAEPPCCARLRPAAGIFSLPFTGRDASQNSFWLPNNW